MSQLPLLDFPHDHARLERLLVYLDHFRPPSDKEAAPNPETEAARLLKPVRYLPVFIRALVTDERYRKANLDRIWAAREVWRQKHWAPRDYLRHRARILAGQIKQEFKTQGDLSLQLQLSLKLEPELMEEVSRRFPRIGWTRSFSDFRQLYLKLYFTPRAAAYQNSETAARGYAKAGQGEMVTWCLQDGGSAERAIQGAARRGRTELVESLIAQYGLANPDGALTAAAKGGHLELVTRFLVVPENFWQPAFEVAIQGNHRPVIHHLISATPPGQICFSYAAIVAARFGRSHLFKFFLRQLESPKHILSASFSAALANGHLHIMQRILTLQNKFQYSEEADVTNCASRGHFEAIRWLLDLAKRLKVKQHEVIRLIGQAIIGATWGGYTAMVEFLVAKLPPSKVPAARIATTAANLGYLDLFQLGLKLGARAGENLTWAAGGGHPEIVEIILKTHHFERAYLDAAAKEAAIYGHLEVVKILFRAGARDLSRVIWAAVRHDRLELLRQIFGSWKSSDRSLPRAEALFAEDLEAAGKHGSLEIIQLLLQYLDLPLEPVLIGAAQTSQISLMRLVTSLGCEAASYSQALEKAGLLQQRAAVRFLLECGVRPTQRQRTIIGQYDWLFGEWLDQQLAEMHSGNRNR